MRAPLTKPRSKRRTAGLGILAAACGLAIGFSPAPPSAQAAPVFISKAYPQGNGVLVGLRTYSQGGTRCKINLFTRIFYERGTGSRRIAVAGGLGRQSVNGCDDQRYYQAVVPAKLKKKKRYVVCVRATNNNNYGKTIAHTSCRRFRG